MEKKVSSFEKKERQNTNMLERKRVKNEEKLLEDAVNFTINALIAIGITLVGIKSCGDMHANRKEASVIQTTPKNKLKQYPQLKSDSLKN